MSRVAIPPKAKREPLEIETVGLILRAVNASGMATLWRNNTGALKDATGRLVRYGLAEGSADLIGFVHGKEILHDATFLAVEVKRNTKSMLTDDQARWLAFVRDHGGLAMVATGVDEVIECIRRHLCSR